MKNNVYRVDIYLYFCALNELKMYAEKHTLDSANNKIKKEITNLNFVQLFNCDEFCLDTEKLDRLINCVGNALFVKNQKDYFSKFTDIFSVFLACTTIQSNHNQLFTYICDNCEKDLTIFTSKFQQIFNKKYPVYRNEMNKIKYYMQRKINSKNKTGEKKVI